MQLVTPRDFGRHVRACRRFRMLSQAQLARAVGASRQWLAALERGKPTAELGLCLRTFEELGLDLSVTRAAAPDWTVPLTTMAERKEAKSLSARRRRRMEARNRARSLRDGSVRPDPERDKDWEKTDDTEYVRLLEGRD